MTRYETAVANHKKGYNCAQAVFAAFSDVTGLEREYALRLSAGFGGGMGPGGRPQGGILQMRRRARFYQYRYVGQTGIDFDG